MPRAIHYVGGDTAPASCILLSIARHFHQSEPGLPLSCFPLPPLAPIPSRSHHQCVPGPMVCTFSPSTAKEHPCKCWVVTFCWSGSVAQWLIPLLHWWSRDQRAMEPHPGLCMEPLCDALGSCRLLSCSKLSNLEFEICRISPYISTQWFPHILFFQAFLAMLNAAPGSKQFC